MFPSLGMVGSPPPTSGAPRPSGVAAYTPFHLPMVGSPPENCERGCFPAQSAERASNACETCEPCDDNEPQSRDDLPTSPVLNQKSDPGTARKSQDDMEYDHNLLQALAVNVWHAPLIESPLPGLQKSALETTMCTCFRIH